MLKEASVWNSYCLQVESSLPPEEQHTALFHQYDKEGAGEVKLEDTARVLFDLGIPVTLYSYRLLTSRLSFASDPPLVMAYMDSSVQLQDFSSARNPP